MRDAPKLSDLTAEVIAQWGDREKGNLPSINEGNPTCLIWYAR